MSRNNSGRHELGQNFLVDTSVIQRIATLASAGTGALVEWGAGDGALTLALQGLGRPLEAVEIDPTRAASLRRRVGPHVCIAEGDILRHAPPAGSTVVSNVPFHLTTPILRHLLRIGGWQDAVLLVQWEVARKRAAVGGTTLLTAQWWPWYEFELDRRVPAAAFLPRPSVDGGVLRIERRSEPLLAGSDRDGYQAFTAKVFAGRGHGLSQILLGAGVPRSVARTLCRRNPRGAAALPGDLRPQEWVVAFRAARRR